MAGRTGLLVLVAACLAATAMTAPTNFELTNKLVELIIKKSFEEFSKEISKDPMDVNQPDTRGRLPLIEAVRSKDVRFVDAVLQFSALVKAKDPATGETPIEIAFKNNDAKIARLLLSYGADPNIEDRKGVKAREFAKSKELQAFVQTYDNEGPQGFEDEPGSWVKQKNDAGEEYWFNLQSLESRWNYPPQCSWQRVEAHGHPIKYVNALTGQEVFKIPRALAWRKVNANGQELWYNWVANMTMLESPHELPPALQAEAERLKNIRWYNPKTQQFSWEDPRYHTAWRAVLEKQAEKPYYYNVETGDTTWEIPDEMAWTQVEDESNKGQFYFFNSKTGESTWEQPDHMAWVKHEHDL